MLNFPHHPRRRGDVVLRELGREAMLYDPVRDQVVRLNGTSRRIWELCDGARDAAAIEAALRLEFKVPDTADLAADVRAALSALARAGVVEAPGG